jgi:uncharacterized membrane protein (UPF0127 family)
MTKVDVRFNGDKVEAEVADSLLKKSWGLSRRSEGKMLFVFSGERKPAIDMMLVSQPLYLYFMDADRVVVDSYRAEPWGVDPRTWRLYRPCVDSKFLLESFEDLDLREGDKLSFDL